MLVEPIELDDCCCQSPAQDPIAYELPDGAEISIIVCVECGGLVEYDIDFEQKTGFTEETGRSERELEKAVARAETVQKERREAERIWTNPMDPWQILCYHPDYFDPDEIESFVPSDAGEGDLKIKSDQSNVYHLPHSDGGVLCGNSPHNKLTTRRNFKYEVDVHSDRLGSLRPCGRCAAQIQKFRERRIISLQLVQSLEGEVKNG